MKPLPFPASPLPESIRWNPGTDELYWVDILGGRLFVAGRGTSSVRSTHVGLSAGVAAHRETGGYIVAADQAFSYLDNSLRKEDELPLRGRGRFNDGAVDTAGRLLVGRLEDGPKVGAGAVYQLEGRHARPIVGGLTVPNGIGFSPDGETLYVVESWGRKVYAFNYDSESGAATNQRIHISLDDQHARPDGIVVDAHGAIWIAMWEGAQIRRVTGAGELAETRALPVRRVTSCCIAGADLQTLYITTAQVGATQREIGLGAGMIFMTRVEAAGCATTPFAG
jgi:sugar lactone lactonase YvrE